MSDSSEKTLVEKAREEADAFVAIIETLEPLTADERDRVMRAAMILLGLDQG